jgi:energy-coupling factor transport system permease protein
LSDISLFRPGDSGLHRLHPLTKLSISGFSLLASITLPAGWMVAAFYFFVMVPLAAWGRMAKRFLATGARIIWPFMLSLFPIQGFFGRGTTVLFEIGRFTLKLEGILLAADYSARILVGIGAAMMLMFVTRPDHLMQALGERGFPRNLGYIVVTSLQIIPRFQDKAQMILNAQRARGLETQGPLWQRARRLFPLIGPLILGSIIDIDERAIALEARAFNHPGPKTSLHILADSRGQKALRMVFTGLMVVLVFWRLWGWLAP